MVASRTDIEALLKAPDVARILGVDVRTVWRWASTGVIPAPLRIGTPQPTEGKRTLKSCCAARWRRADIEGFISQKAEEAERESAKLPALP